MPDDKQKIKLLRNGKRGYCQCKGEKRISILDSVMKAVMARDSVCVYCKNSFGDTRCNMATWEHISGIVKDIGINNIALCCGSCNYSRGNQLISFWFKKDYCISKNINEKTVADIIVKYLENNEK